MGGVLLAILLVEENDVTPGWSSVSADGGGSGGPGERWPGGAASASGWKFSMVLMVVEFPDGRA
jgi:hypothetical protein